MRLQSNAYQHFRTAIIFSLAIAIALAVFVGIFGKNESFLLINGHYSIEADYFFNGVTYLGDGVIWVPLFIYVLLYKRDFFLAVVVALLVCTLFTHGLKQVIFPGTPRPLRLLPNLARAVPLLKGHDNYSNSFPSGHTSTAFTFSLLLAFLVQHPIARYLYPLLAFLVGYSRVYLAQHFVTDVLAGCLIGVVSSWLGLVVYDYYKQKKNARKAQSSP